MKGSRVKNSIIIEYQNTFHSPVFHLDQTQICCSGESGLSTRSNHTDTLKLKILSEGVVHHDHRRTRH
jgi:hypothetical protein